MSRRKSRFQFFCLTLMFLSGSIMVEITEAHRQNQPAAVATGRQEQQGIAELFGASVNPLPTASRRPLPILGIGIYTSPRG